MKKIKLSRGYFAKVDNDDYHKLVNRKWAYAQVGYAFCHQWKNGKTHHEYMHRLIMNPPKGLMIDHINHDKLDNRKSNLRIVTKSQNNMNQYVMSKVNKSSKYKGVSYIKKSSRWRAYIKINQKYLHLGHFDNESTAAKAYNDKAKIIFGVYALLNRI